MQKVAVHKFNPVQKFCTDPCLLTPGRLDVGGWAGVGGRVPQVLTQQCFGSDFCQHQASRLNYSLQTPRGLTLVLDFDQNTSQLSEVIAKRENPAHRGLWISSSVNWQAQTDCFATLYLTLFRLSISRFLRQMLLQVVCGKYLVYKIQYEVYLHEASLKLCKASFKLWLASFLRYSALWYPPRILLYRTWSSIKHQRFS